MNINERGARSLPIAYAIIVLTILANSVFARQTFTTYDFPGATSTFIEAASGDRLVGDYTDSGGNSRGFLWNGLAYIPVNPPGSTRTGSTAFRLGRLKLHDTSATRYDARHCHRSRRELCLGSIHCLKWFMARLPVGRLHVQDAHVTWCRWSDCDGEQREQRGWILLRGFWSPRAWISLEWPIDHVAGFSRGVRNATQCCQRYQRCG
jgi:hypothetical protein